MRQGAANVRSRTPLVPKELILPVCQRLALVLFVMCGTALSIRLVTLYRMNKYRGNARRLDASFNGTHLNGSHFFLDIGNSGKDGISQTRHLEEIGWRGVCASPFPEAARSCKAITMPVVAVDGDQVTVPDCSSPFQVLLSTFRSCPDIQRAGVGIVDLLKLSKAPSVIDYVSLDTQGSELAILKRFPFDKFCVRAWTVAYRNEADIQKLFEVQNCRAKQAGDIVWARCSCSSFSENLLQVRAIARADVEPIPRRRKRNFDSAAMVTTGVLPEETFPLGLGSSLMRRSFA